MKKIEAHPLTPTSWILTSWGNRIGVLSSVDGVWNVLGAGINQQAATLDILQEALNWKVEFQERSELEDKPEAKIGNLPVKHPDPQNIQHEPRVTYTKTANSNVKFGAGYYAITFVNGWSGSFCPKAATLDEYPHVGPFASKLELNTVLTNKNRELKK